MDIYCPNCEEPWDTYCLNEEADALAARDGIAYEQAYREVQRNFYKRGCRAFEIVYTGGSWCEPRQPSDSGKLSKGAAMGALASILGDDIDGIASMMDDAMYMGLVE